MASANHRRVLTYEPLFAGGPPRVYAPTEVLWDAWAFAAMECELGLRGWKNAAMELKDAAFRAYREALDREEQAAMALAARVAPKVARRLHKRWALGGSAA